MKRYLNVDYLDLVWLYGDAYDEKAIDRLLQRCAAHGFTGVLWRVAACGKAVYPSRVRKVFDGDGRERTEPLVRLLRRFDPLAVACQSAARYGLEVWAWTTLLDDYYPGLESELVSRHPEVQLWDRTGQTYFLGVLCYAHREVVDERLQEVGELAGYPVTGIYLCTRSHAEHSTPVRQEDTFGYNPPVVERFRARYGLDIRKDGFEKALWYDLLGEYLTEFILQAGRVAHARGKKMAVGIRRNHYAAVHVYPMAKMRFDWRTWVYEGALDALVVGAGDDPLEEHPAWWETLEEQYRLLDERGVELWTWVVLFDWYRKYGPHPHPDFPTKPASVIAEGVRRACGNRAIGALALHEAANVELFDLWSQLRC